MKTLKVALVAACAVVVSWVFTASADIPASAYVQDGLVAQFDGIENAGAGTHNPAATVWKDLKGSHDVPLISGDAFGDDCIKIVRGTRETETALLDAYAQITIEFNARPTAMDTAGSWNAPIASIPYVGSFGWDGRAGAISVMRPQSATATAYNYRTYDSGYSKLADLIKAGVFQTYTAMPGYGVKGSEDDSVYVNAAKVAKTTGLDWDGGTRAQSLLMTVGGTKTASEIRSLRIYNRALTADEVSYNALVDRGRFGGQPEHYRMNATSGNLEVLVAVECQGVAGGTVSINGGTAAKSASCWAEYGSTLSIAVSAPADTSLLWWEGGEPTAGGTAETYTYKVTEPAVLAAFCGKGIKTWSGAANARWDDEGNWDPAGVPEENDVVRVPAGTSVLIDGSTASLVLADIVGTVVFANWDNCLNATKVRVVSGGVVTSTGPFKDAANKSRVSINCGDLTVEKGGSIDVSAQGWCCGDSSNMCGYGPGTFARGHVQPVAGKPNAVAGGSHGGAGSFYSVDQRSAASANPTAAEVAALTYGSANAPETHGSGGYSTAGTGGAGGGVVRIVASGMVTVCGSVLANGRDSRNTTNYDCGGAGGSIYITCRTFHGTNGLVRARGGNSHEQWSRNFYAGGGGRVAIIFDAAEQAKLPVPKGMEYSADCGPLQPPGDTGFVQARPGTLYFSNDALIDRTGCSLFGALDFANVTNTWTIESFRMTNGWAALARDSVEMRVTGDFEITGASQVNRRMSTSYVRDPRANGTRWEVGGTGTYCLTNLLCFMQASASAPRLTVGGDFKVSNQGVVMVWPSQTAMNPDAAQPVLTNVGARVSIGGQLRLSSTGKLYLCGHPQNGAYPHVSAASLSVDATSYVDANEQGYLGTSSQAASACLACPIPLTPTFPKLSFWSKSDYASGGGAHGGRGGHHFSNAPLMTESYDSPTDPVLPGAGGVAGFNSWLGRRGGGVIFLDITGVAVVDGVVRANGGSGSGIYSSGAAGGTVRLKCRTISGAGLISANGAAANIAAQYIAYNGGGGGGGCVWVGYDPSAQSSVACDVQFQALGGIANPQFAKSGEPGTLYFSDGRLVEGVTTFRHAGRLYLPDIVTSLEFDELTIDGGFLDLPGGSLTVRGDLKIVGADRRLYGLTITNGSLACGGAVSASNATVTVNGGLDACAERFKVGGEVALDGGHLYVDFAPGDGAAKVDFKGGVTMDNEATVRITSPSNALAGVPGVTVTAPRAVLGDKCWIKPICCFTTGSSPIFRIGDITCSPTGGFDATAGGIGVEYPGGPLYGYDNERYDGRGVMYTDSMASVPAPGHGGRGGNAVEPGGTFNRTTYARGRGLCYGNERKPVLSGLAGSGSRQSAPSCRGGGVVRIEANKLLLNGGSLIADGENPGDSYNFRSGGSGGSVYVRAYKFVGGGGLVSAKGGNGTSYSSGWHNDWSAPSAGGGRIAIWSSDGDTNVTTNVSGGDMPYAGEDEARLKRKGTAGTLRWCTLGGLMLLVR